MNNRNNSLPSSSLLKALRKRVMHHPSIALTSALLASAALCIVAPSATAQARPTLSELIDTIPQRPIVPIRTDPIRTESPALPPTPATPTIDAPATEAEEQPISLLLRLSEKRVYVYRGEQVETSYPVAIGRPGWETPTGEFEIFHRLVDPGWTNPLTSEVMPPGPNNPLGDRWIAFWTDGQNSIGFHGTPNRASVGTAASHGCVRMYNEDVRQLYSTVEIGTTVTVIQ